MGTFHIFARPTDFPPTGVIDVRVFAEAMPLMVFVTDGSNVLEWANVQFQNYTGLDSRSLQLDGWLAAIHPDDRRDICKSQLPLITESTSSERRCRLLRHDGKSNSYILHRTIVRGTRDLYIGSFIEDPSHGARDTASSSTHRTIAIAQDDHNDMQEIIDALPLIIWEADRCGAIVRVNAAWHAASGLGPAHAPCFADIVTPEVIGAFLGKWQYCVANDEIFDCETVIADRLCGDRACKALAIPTSISSPSVAKGRWVGSFRMLPSVLNRAAKPGREPSA